MGPESTAPPAMGIVCPSSILGTGMNENAVHLKDLIKSGGLTREAAAGLLYVSLDTVHKWLKPETTVQRNPCPRWAVELLAYKTHQKIPALPAGGGLGAPEPAAEAPPAAKPVPKGRRKASSAETGAKVAKPAKAAPAKPTRTPRRKTKVV